MNAHMNSMHISGTPRHRLVGHARSFACVFPKLRSGNEDPTLEANAATHWTPHRRVALSQAGHARHAGWLGCVGHAGLVRECPLHSLLQETGIPYQLKEPASQVETRGGALASLIDPLTLGASQGPPEAEQSVWPIVFWLPCPCTMPRMHQNTGLAWRSGRQSARAHR